MPTIAKDKDATVEVPDPKKEDALDALRSGGMMTVDGDGKTRVFRPSAAVVSVRDYVEKDKLRGVRSILTFTPDLKEKCWFVTIPTPADLEKKHPDNFNIIGWGDVRCEQIVDVTMKHVLSALVHGLATAMVPLEGRWRVNTNPADISAEALFELQHGMSMHAMSAALSTDPTIAALTAAATRLECLVSQSMRSHGDAPQHLKDDLAKVDTKLTTETLRGVDDVLGKLKPASAAAAQRFVVHIPLEF